MDNSPVTESPAAAALDEAISKLGGQAELATACHVTPQAVHQWKKKGRPPAGKVLHIEEATGVSRHALRPDVFGPPPADQPEQGRAAA